MICSSSIVESLLSIVGTVDSLFVAGLALQALDAKTSDGRKVYRGTEREALDALYLDLLSR